MAKEIKQNNQAYILLLLQLEISVTEKLSSFYTEILSFLAQYSFIFDALPTKTKPLTPDPARDGSNWYGYAGQNPVNYVDSTGLSTTRDDFAYNKLTSGDWTYKEAAAFQMSAAESNQGYITEYTGPTTQDPDIQHQLNLINIDRSLYPQLKQYEGKDPWPKWLQTLDETVEKFLARNFFFFTPGDYLYLLDGRIVPMSESGTQFAYSERIFDGMFFCATSFAGVINLVRASNTISVASKTTSDVTSIYKKHSLSNVEARQWYLEKEAEIPNVLNKNLSLEDQARQAFNYRNQIRTETRELMADRGAALKLYKTDPNPTWEEIVDKQIKKGLSGDDIYREIINSSQRSRTSINKSLGLE